MRVPDLDLPNVCTVNLAEALTARDNTIGSESAELFEPNDDPFVN